MKQPLTVVQVLPALDSGGVERGTLEVASFLAEKGHRSIVISAGGRLVTDLEKQGSEHIAWPIGKKSVLTFRYILTLRRFFIDNKVDIIHARSRLPAWMAYLAWKTLPSATRPKFITTVHGQHSVSRYSQIMTQGEQVIVNSESTLDYVLENYPKPSGEITLNYRGIDRTEFPFGFKAAESWKAQWFKDFPQTRGRQLLVLPGRLTRWKGHHDFIEVIAQLKQRHPNVHGLIVGEVEPGKSHYLDELHQAIADKGLTDTISFTGHRQDIREVMSLAHIVMSLSLVPEAFGRTTIEALSLGIPVMGYAHGGVKEQLGQILPEGQIDLGDINAIATLAEQWLTQAPKVKEAHPFTLDSMLNTTLNVYQTALKAS